MIKRLNKISLFFIFAAIPLMIFIAFPAAGEENPAQIEQNFVADIADEVEEGVVMIDTERQIEIAESHPFEEEIFRFFFPDRYDEMPEPDDEPRTREGIGSGFIATEEGHIITNQHVVADADEIKVTIKGYEEQKDAEVIWSDYGLDLAILKVETDAELAPIPLGDSEDIRQGNWAVAIGNPVGFDYTVTLGVVSALERPIEIPTPEGQVRRYRNLIQTDAAINPGNSGGPLVNIDGEVIGINTAVATRAQGIGFAIPINEVKFALEDIREYGEVRIPWLGIYYREVTPELQDHFNLEDDTGIIVVDVFENSPADEAGLQPYDVITELDREEIETTEQFADKIREREVGDEILLRVMREGEPDLIPVELTNQPEEL
ncbi:S1C family serine protease [Halarsenatibacter silvermanii]|uniref:Serine protease, S1-C subfamily, contains C-terminal PDZ domain n=1 Tax=Halarsenatibacter silvermanii TaxID=321763 RepID=A0A1G9QAM0_9FIRM|nr:trypsin-like peptidase domain-containing protein [Halarsenatibacter silvermanii]SDM08114.1 serine protease, S1-C subfamily, contains C-terminal PDZ domain [Halarsenatibacter silvermanii]